MLDLGRSSRWLPIALTLAGALALGCDDDGGETGAPDAASGPDAAAEEDAGPPDLGEAADMALATDMDPPTPDMAVDAMTPACEFPTARLDDGPAAQALAAAPAMCGQAPYTWLDDPEMGQVIDRVEVQRFNAAALSAITAAAGIELPRPLVNDIVVEQVTYLTQAKGARVEATTLVGYPLDPGPDAPTATFALLHGTAGFSDDCAPSSDLETQGLVAAIASTGYTIVAPDYIGLKARGEPTGFLHPYLIGEPTAMSVLDAVRAAGRMGGDPIPRCVSPEVVIVGGSQGGHAALWTDLLAPYYAPELTLRATVATVPPADLVGQMELALSSRINATLNAIALTITGADWYGYNDRLSEALVPPLDVDLPRFAAMGCTGSIDLSEEDYPTNDTIFTPLLLEATAAGALTDVDPWGCFSAVNSLLTTPVERRQPDRDDYGVLYVLGENDELVNTPIEREAFDALCADGWPLVYLECARARHGPTTIWALPEIFDFIEARAAGEPVPAEQRCVRAAPVDCRGEPME